MNKNSAVAAAKAQDTERALRSGIRVRVSRVSQLLIDEAVNEVPAPAVPYFHDEEKGYDIPNPNDPRYLAELDRYERAQLQATFDAILIWGVELVDEMPPIDTWLPKLQFFARRNPSVDLSQYDLEDALEVEFVYKKFIAAGDIEELVSMLDETVPGASEEDKAKATALFRGDEERGTN